MRGAVLGLSIGMLLACHSGTQESQEKRDLGPFSVGAVVSLSGSDAGLGASTLKGFRLAIEEANQAGGIKGRAVNLVQVDDESAPDKAAKAADRLAETPSVLALLGEVTSASALAMAQSAEQHRISMVSSAATHPAVTQVGKYIFRTCFVDSFQAYALAKFTKQTLHFSRAAILYDEHNAYSRGLKDLFTRKYSQLGARVVKVAPFTEDREMISAALRAVRAEKPEVIFIPSYAASVRTIAAVAREMEMTVPLLGADGWDLPLLLEGDASVLEGAYFTAHFAQDRPDLETERFVRTFTHAFGGPPDVLAALGYDAARVVLHALDVAKHLSRDGIRQALARTRGFVGVTGVITMGQDRNAEKPAVVMQIRGGEAHFVTAVNP